MLEKQFLACGRFDVDLKASTPWGVRSALSEWSLVCVTPTRLDAPTAAAALAQSMFTGVVRLITEERRRIEGAHATILIGDEDGKGDMQQRAASVPDSLANIIDAALAAGNGVTAGQIKSIPSTFGLKPFGYSVRRWLNEGIAEGNHVKTLGRAIAFTALQLLEWRLNDDLTLDVDDPGAIYQLDPQVLFSDQFAPSSLGLRVIPASVTPTSVDAENWISGVRIFDEDSSAFGDATLSPNPYKGPGGDDLVMERAEHQSENTNSTNLDAACAGILARESVLYPRLDIETSEDVARWVEPGDRVYAYNPAAGIADSAGEQITVHGQTITPVESRIYGMRYPRPRGSGLYLLTPTDPQVLVDLTDHAEPDNGITTLEVGQIRPIGIPVATLPWFPTPT